MTSKTTNKLSPEVHTRAARMVPDHKTGHPSRWATITSIRVRLVHDADAERVSG